VRKYEHVDVTKDFELKSQRREAEKIEKLEEFYDKHDQRALEVKHLIQTHIPPSQVKDGQS